MSIVIDPDFSVYWLVQRQQQANLLLNHRRTMSITSYEIENATLLDGARTRIFAGFQYLSKFLPQMQRYRRIAERAQLVYVFGVPDIAPPPIANITYVPLRPEDQLAKEWFLLSFGRNYFSALATEEQTHFTDPDHQRVFKGVWTFDLPMVQLVHDWLSSALDLPPLILSEAEIDLRGQLYLLNRSTTRLIERLQKLSTAAYAMPVIRQEIEILLDRSLKRAARELQAAAS